MSRYRAISFPLLIGLTVGFAFSLLGTPFYETWTSCHGEDDSPLARRVHNKLYARSSLGIVEPDEFEPRINLQAKPRVPTGDKEAKVIRPRHASTELGIRKKLFIGIICTGNSISAPYATFHSKSFSRVQEMNKYQELESRGNTVIFFVNNPEMINNSSSSTTHSPDLLNVVNFYDDRDHLLTFHAIKYIMDNYIEQFDWFFLVTDTTFIRFSKLINYVSHISISQEVYLGQKMLDSIYCRLSSGILLSRVLMLRMVSNMDWCIQNAYSDESSENLGRCVLHGSSLACQSSVNGKRANFYTDPGLNLDISSIDQLMYSSEFNSSITVSPVSSLDTLNKLELYFMHVETDEIEKEIARLEDDIRWTVCKTPDGCDSLTWPLGVPPPYKPTSRHDVIRWDYFNMTHVFLGTDFAVVETMSPEYKIDVVEVIDFAMENLNKEFNRTSNDTSPRLLEFHSLLNGYKQFDPTRGAHYILDLIVNDKTRDQVDMSLIHKRVNVMRPLGEVEFIHMPYVTETTHIDLNVMFSIDYDSKEIDAFFAAYAQNILDSKEQAQRVSLRVVYLMTETEFHSNEEKLMQARVSDHIRSITKRYSYVSHHDIYDPKSHVTRLTETRVKLSMSMYSSESYRQMAVMEHLSAKSLIQNDSIVLLAPLCIEFQAEFLNRVRLNTIKQAQVFFPIAFYEYNPIISGREDMSSSSSKSQHKINIDKNSGYFNSYTYSTASFYLSDYLAATKEAASRSTTDLYNLFNQWLPSVHILRGTDQAVKCRWHSIDDCSSLLKDEKERCERQRESNLGTKAQLAQHFMKHYT